MFFQEYQLYGKKLAENGGGLIPAAIMLRKSSDGTFLLDKYIIAKDAGDFAPSIREFCQQKPEVAEKMIRQYGVNQNDLYDQLMENLIAYLKANDLVGIYLEDKSGKQMPLT